MQTKSVIWMAPRAIEIMHSGEVTKLAKQDLPIHAMDKMFQSLYPYPSLRYQFDRLLNREIQLFKEGCFLSNFIILRSTNSEIRNGAWHLVPALIVIGTRKDRSEKSILIVHNYSSPFF